MSKKLIITIAVIIVILAGGAVTWLVLANHKTNTAASVQKTTSTPATPKVTALTLDNATTKLKTAGFTIDSKDTAYYQLIGADNGYKVTVNNGDATIEFYEFSNSKSQTAANSQLASSGTVFENGNIVMLIDADDNSNNPVSSSLITKIENTLQ